MKIAEANDEELVRRAGMGDEEAVQALFDRWLPAMRAKARRALRGVVRRRVSESDVIQEAYLAAFLRMKDFEDRGDGSFGRWIAKILDNKLKEQIRRHVGAEKRTARSEVTQADGGSEHLVPSPDATPSAEAMRDERREALRRALDLIPERYRMVLRLVHEEGLSLQEVGRRTGRSANAACKIYGRAVQTLGRLLEGAE